MTKTMKVRASAILLMVATIPLMFMGIALCKGRHTDAGYAVGGLLLVIWLSCKAVLWVTHDDTLPY